jgi:large repetitive protein
MKTNFRSFKWLIVILLTVSVSGIWAQTSQTATQSACIGNQPYKVDPILGATFVWSITGGVPADYLIIGSGDQISIDWNTAGTYVLSVYSYYDASCPSPTQSVTVTVEPEPVGPTLNVKTPNLANVCIGTDVSATFNAGTGGVGCTDAFEYRFDGGSWVAYTPGTDLSTTGHTSVDIQGRRAGCTADAGCTGTAWTTLASWIVTPLPTADISYAGTPFCKSVGSSQAVTLTGTTGGIYSAPVGLTLDASTGGIIPSTSTAGTYTVTYTIAAAGGCAEVVATTSVTITTAPAATIAYPGTPYCTSVVTAQAVTLTGTTGGTFTAPAGLTIDGTTGAIIPGTSIADTYIVTYTIAASGGCSAVLATTSVTILDVPTTSSIYHN